MKPNTGKSKVPEVIQIARGELIDAIMQQGICQVSIEYRSPASPGFWASGCRDSRQSANGGSPGMSCISPRQNSVSCEWLFRNSWAAFCRGLRELLAWNRMFVSTLSMIALFARFVCPRPPVSLRGPKMPEVNWRRRLPFRRAVAVLGMHGKDVFACSAQNVRQGSLLAPCQPFQAVVKVVRELDLCPLHGVKNTSTSF